MNFIVLGQWQSDVRTRGALRYTIAKTNSVSPIKRRSIKDHWMESLSL